MFAQTYTPKAIRLQGADGLDQAELMRLVDLQAGAPVSKEQIEAALHRLGDSGLFSEIRYTVDSDALVFILKPAPGSQALPVRFTNFVWWKPEELETLVEARVPLFRGQLPLTGQLTDQVEAALVGLLADKGVPNAQVSARLSTLGKSSDPSNGGVSGVALSIEHPQIMVGEIKLTGTAPEVAAQMEKVLEALSTHDFDTLLTAKEIIDNTVDTHRNAGYLDATVNTPFFSEPYLATVGYRVDASAVVYPGARYRVSAISFTGVPPGLEAEVAKASALQAGEPAGEMTLRIAEGLAARALENHGMLDATAKAEVSKDSSAHTVAYRFVVVPGPVYTFAGIDISALTAGQQQLFLRQFHAKPGTVADASVRAEMAHALGSVGSTRARIEAEPNRAAHTVKYVLTTRPQEESAAAQ